MSCLRKIKLVIAYDGTEYHGWQIQPGLRTVQGTLCEAATSVLRHPAHVQGASRTDAGVHARGQVGLLETSDPIPIADLLRSLNRRLPQDIAVVHGQEVGPDFDVMRDVTRKGYRYMIHTGRSLPTQHARFYWHFPASLDVEAMHAAAQYLVGSRDFRSFAASLDKSPKTARTMFRCAVAQGFDRSPDLVAIEMEASGFLRHMARIIAGTLIAVGRGHWRPEYVADILAARERRAAGHRAPACGLTLEWIGYRQDDPTTVPVHANVQDELAQRAPMPDL